MTEHKQRPAGTSGSALVVVLLLLAMVAGLTAVVARSVSGAAAELGAAQDTLLADSDLRAGLELAAATILKLGEDMRIADAEATLADRRIAVHITNERARIDLNKAPDAVLTSMFKARGLEPAEAATLTAALADWRGGAPSQTLAPPTSTGFETGPHLPGFSSGGAEASAATAPQQAIGTRYFFHPAQLGSLPGFTPKIVRLILPIVTVASGSAQIDPFIASAQALEAMPEMSPSKVEGFVEARNGNTSRSTALLQLGLDKSYVSEKAAPGWRLEIAIKDRFGRLHQHEVVIVMVDDEKPYRVLYAGDAFRP